jgi:hypothetical protein
MESNMAAQKRGPQGPRRFPLHPGQCCPGVGAILRQLCREVIRRLEPANVPQACHPRQPHPLAVEIAGKAEQVRFERAGRVVKSGPSALVHHAAKAALPGLHLDGVHAIRRQELLRWHRADVDGRHPQRATSPSAPTYHPAHAVPPPQQTGRTIEITPGDRPPDA